MKKGGLPLVVCGSRRVRPGASEARDPRARDVCCIFATPLYVVAGDIPYAALLYYYNTICVPGDLSTGYPQLIAFNYIN